jgi:hypothetical protein
LQSVLLLDLRLAGSSGMWWAQQTERAKERPSDLLTETPLAETSDTQWGLSTVQQLG